MTGRPNPHVDVRLLDATERDAAAGVLAQGMRDNPINIAAFGANPARRRAGLERMFRTLLHAVPGQRPFAAVLDGAVVGVCGLAVPGTCRPTPPQQLRLLAALVRSGPASTARVLQWTRAWGGVDPDAPHVHLGPVAVLPEWQGRGVGGALLRAHTAALDDTGTAGYLETDKDVNVDMYTRHGYAVAGRRTVLGVPCWFMTREPR